jgi:hypothetical protein
MARPSDATLTCKPQRKISRPWKKRETATHEQRNAAHRNHANITAKWTLQKKTTCSKAHARERRYYVPIEVDKPELCDKQATGAIFGLSFIGSVRTSRRYPSTGLTLLGAGGDKTLANACKWTKQSTTLGRKHTDSRICWLLFFAATHTRKHASTPPPLRQKRCREFCSLRACGYPATQPHAHLTTSRGEGPAGSRSASHSFF